MTRGLAGTRLNQADVAKTFDLLDAATQKLTVSGNLPTSAVTGIDFFRVQLTPAAVAANTSAEQLFTVTGLAAGSIVVVNKPTAQAGLGIVGLRVSAQNQLAITFGNFTGAGITPTAGELYLVLAFRKV